MSVISAVIVEGHRVASGLSGNPRFPGGTIRMQLPHFQKRGLDLSRFHPGTLNVSIAPLRYLIVRPRFTFRSLKWHPTEPAEDFSFFDLIVHRERAASVAGLIYFPHPETKLAHFQRPDVIELLLPWMEGTQYGTKIQLEAPADQMIFESRVPQDSPRAGSRDETASFR